MTRTEADSTTAAAPPAAVASHATPPSRTPSDTAPSDAAPPAPDPAPADGAPPAPAPPDAAPPAPPDAGPPAPAPPDAARPDTARPGEGSHHGPDAPGATRTGGAGPTTVDLAALLHRVAEAAHGYLAGIGERPVGASEPIAALRQRLGGALPSTGTDPAQVLEQLIALAPTATVATTGPRYFGFVTGGSLPGALAAEMLAVALDQNAAMAVLSPLAATAEEVAAGWLVDLLGLPADASVGFVTGGQAANTTCLAVARHHVLARHGWDVETAGLNGAPPVTTMVNTDRHATVDFALRSLGLGAPTVTLPADDQGRMLPRALAAALSAASGPVIVCAQAGNVNTGACDPFADIVALTRRHGAWLHVDGAFGLWAQAAPRRRWLTDAVAGADSWAVDGHKWLNVPYDCGYAITAHPDSHRAAFASPAAYYVTGGADAPRDPMAWAPEASRRARGIATWAALRSLGRDGVADLIERCCRHAARFAALMSAEPGVAVLNDVQLNQVLVRFEDSDEHTGAVIDAVQRDGTCWAGGSTWRGRAVLRWSVANWSTTEADITRSAAAVLATHRRLRRPGPQA